MSKEQLLTSKNEVPKHKNALEEKYKEEKIEPTKRIDETNVGSIKDELPVPSGWRLLVLGGCLSCFLIKFFASLGQLIKYFFLLLV